MTPTEAELKVVRDWSKPQNIRDIRSFLVFTNYYRRFVKNIGFDQERSTRAVGTISVASLSAIEGCIMHCTGIVISRP